MKRWISFAVILLVAKFNLSFWIALPKEARVQMVQSVAINYCREGKASKAKAFSMIDLESWEVSIHVVPLELSL